MPLDFNMYDFGVTHGVDGRALIYIEDAEEDLSNFLEGIQNYAFILIAENALLKKEVADLKATLESMGSK